MPTSISPNCLESKQTLDKEARRGRGEVVVSLWGGASLVLVVLLVLGEAAELERV